MRISWTVPRPCHEATTAYAPPAISKVSTAEGMRSAKPPEPCAAELTGSRDPSSWIRISWTPSTPKLPPAATMAYVALPITNVSASLALRSMSKPPEPWIAELTASRVPFARTRISWTPCSPYEVAMAYALPSISNASMSVRP